MIHDTKTQARRAAIMEQLRRDGSIRVVDLSQKYNISGVTIRKDLIYLESAGLLKRVHGGATLQHAAAREFDYFGRRDINREQKMAVAKAAAALLEDGDSVVINVGSTTSFVVDELKNSDKELLVITNVFSIVEQLQNSEKVTTFFLGGRVDQEHQITVGDSVIEQLSRYSIDKLIMGTDGVDPVHGVTSYNHAEDYIMHQMIAQSKVRILVADGSKIGCASFVRLADASAFDIIVTNQVDEKAEIIREFERKGIQVIQV